MLTKAADQKRRQHIKSIHKNTDTAVISTSSLRAVSQIFSHKCRSSIVPGSFLWAFFVVLLTFGDITNGQENVGCRFIPTLCIDRNEVCFDDKVFGRCVSITGARIEDIESIPLTEEQSDFLTNTLQELHEIGLGWDHPFVQCEIKQQLSAMRYRMPLSTALCMPLSPAKIMDNDNDDDDVNDKNDDTWYDMQLRNPDIQDILLRQMLMEEREKEAKSHEIANNGNHRPQSSYVDRYENDKRSSKNSYTGFNMYDSNGYNEYPYGRNHKEFLLNDVPPLELERIYDIQQQQQQKKQLYQHQPQELKQLQKQHQEHQQMSLRNQMTPLDEVMLRENAYDYTANRRRKLHQQQQQHPNKEKVFVEGDGLFLTDPQIPKQQHKQQQQQQHREVETLNTMEDKNEANIRRVLADILGFTRHERLDVKKPGPLIGRLPPPPLSPSSSSASSSSAPSSSDHPIVALNQTEELNGFVQDEPQKQKPSKKEVAQDHSNQDHADHIVDESYAHVFVKNPIDSWTDGVRIMNELANILHMQGYFTYLTVQPREVSFRVSDNPEHKTAADIAKVINENRGVKNNLLRRIGVTVIRAGVGDRIIDIENNVSVEPMEIGENTDVARIVMITLAGAGVAALIVVLVTIILIKQNSKDRDKLGHLQSQNSQGADNSSKDYQDLCRGRMASKGNAEHVASGRITSLSKENDRPPSSRSSTSSWCEEPALTNMDISTGHMVLSYMEDHLRNKGRLQREWEALCRYEAEPNARDTAQQPQCSQLNRPNAPLPFDHSRVVLNHLSNAEGLNYINASTIADHDPRAPAYVAAQGPMPSTLAHFWQMIWEQGAVVIVALCRLQENGTMACARYWPEEGAEVYHIYEVHLVSEHIWCDDYLVRSFYLKNLRTSETRTVTQFHFLSWPQGGVPTQAKTLLDFRRKVNKSYRGRSCPIVVHSSLGAGRAGGYILLDLVLGRMNKGAREIDIAATLEHLRDQRAGLVATRQQFEFVLMAVAEEVHAILKALPSNQSSEKRESESNDTNTATGNSETLVDLSGTKTTTAAESKAPKANEDENSKENAEQQPHSSKNPPKSGPSPPARKSN